MGCGSSDEPLERTLLDVGQFCMTSEAAGRVTFSVMVGPPVHCLSGCEGSTTACLATLNGTDIELRSALETRELPKVEECPAGCLGSTATCELEEVPAPGLYRLRFGGLVAAATLPFEGNVPLFGDHACDATVPMLPNPYPSSPGPMSRVPEFEGGAP